MVVNCRSATDCSKRLVFNTIRCVDLNVKISVRLLRLRVLFAVADSGDDSEDKTSEGYARCPA